MTDGEKMRRSKSMQITRLPSGKWVRHKRGEKPKAAEPKTTIKKLGGKKHG